MKKLILALIALTLIVSRADGQIVVNALVSTDFAVSFDVRDGEFWFAEKSGIVTRYSDQLMSVVYDRSAQTNTYYNRGLTGIAVDREHVYLLRSTGTDANAGYVIERCVLECEVIYQSRQTESTGSHTNNKLALVGDQLYWSAGDGWLSGRVRDDFALSFEYTTPEVGDFGRLKSIDINTLEVTQHARGLRQPFGFAFWDNIPVILDVGRMDQEEINVGRGNFGWPCFEGTKLTLQNDCGINNPPSAVVAHEGTGRALTAIVNITGNNFYVGDYVTGIVYEFDAHSRQLSRVGSGWKGILDFKKSNDVIYALVQYSQDRTAVYPFRVGDVFLATPVDPVYAPLDIYVSKVASDTILVANQPVSWTGYILHDTHIHPLVYKASGPTAIVPPPEHAEGLYFVCGHTKTEKSCVSIGANQTFIPSISK